MDLRATAAAATPATTPTTATTTDAAQMTTASAPKKAFTELFAAAQKDLKSGETLARVKGHQFARIKGGERDDQCVNLSGNARNGQVFDLIWRGGRCFHVYGGAGAGHVVVEVGTGKASAKPAGGTTAA